MLVCKGHVACLLIATSYISSLYLIPKKVRQSPRDNATHIRYRILAASLSTILSTVICQRLFRYWNFPPNVTFLEACGIRYDVAFDAVGRTCLLMILFYSGPLISSSIYQYTSYYYGVDDYGNVGEKTGKNKNLNIFSYLWRTIMRYSYFSFD